jgi:orotidine-5'-phosphate decarboxylase
MSIPEQLDSSLRRSRQVALDPTEDARERLIVALDVPTAGAAIDLVDRLENSCRWFKVGLELFVAAGPAILEKLTERGHSVFLDLKFHDIPNTVAGAVRSASGWGVRMMTVHALGGPAMLSAARAALEEVPNPPELLAVTILTSMDGAQLSAVGLGDSAPKQVERLARVGLEAGIGGFVCSPQEVGSLRLLGGPNALLVTPGIRPAGGAAEDQKRIATPAEALRQGASHLVVGRPITQASNPAEAAESILAEMQGSSRELTA